jgi:hypothetical protein
MNKSQGQRQLSTHETSKPPRNQAIASLVIPYKVKEGSKARKEEEAKEHGQRLKSIPSLKETYQHAHGKARCFASVSLGESVM